MGIPGALDLETLTQRQQRLAPVEITADVSKLPDAERKSLAKMIEAAEIMDQLFLRQVWFGNEQLRAQLAKDESPIGRARLIAFDAHKGPWDRIEHNEPFVPGVPVKPPEANFYPAGMTKADVERWIKSLPPEEQKRATGFFTVIRRGADDKLSLVPYSEEYRAELERAAQLLHEAAALTEQPTLRKFLDARADAFLSNDYYASDVAWMELDASIEPTIGPYENYEDEWFNYKAAFEAFIALRDDVETDKLQKFGGELQWLEDNLPIDPKHKNPKLGALAPIRVVNEVYSSGDAARGVRTAAFNLPNDEKVTQEKGSKRVMLKNVQEAKFSNVLVPISKVALSATDQGHVDFDAFFTHILMHELMHGLGPHNITVGGQETTTRKALQETSSALEEAKADISGLWALQKLIDKGVLDRALEAKIYDTFLASSFRTLRFGISEAHGKGMALQVNELLDRGAFVVEEDGTFRVEWSKIKGAVEALTKKIMTIQAEGDYAGAKQMLAELAVIRPQVQKVIDRLAGVPIDILPRHLTAEVLVGRPLGGARP